MAISRAWVAAALCVACGGGAGDGEHDLGGNGLVPAGEQGAVPTPFAMRGPVVSQRGSDNSACFGATDLGPVGDADEAMACELTRALRLTNLGFGDQDVDGKIEPGETLQLFVTLSAPMEHNVYPGVFVRAESRSVSPDSAGDWTYALLPIDPSEEFSLTFDVSPAAQPGEKLAFAMCPTGTRVSTCRRVDELDFELTVD